MEVKKNTAFPIENLVLMFIDIETTGLKAGLDEILEIAIRFTDSDINVISRYHWVLPFNNWDYVNDVVFSMHLKNNLMTECKLSTVNPDNVAKNLYSIIASFKERGQTIMAAGSSVHFDMGFMKIFMPQIFSYLHYRLFDVSTLMEAFKYAGHDMEEMKQIAHPSGRERSHRAEDDIYGSMEMARTMLSIIRRKVRFR